MFAQLKRESLRKLYMAEDKSPKGSIDAPIVDMIQLINEHPNYVTSSSCSGRIAVFCGTPAAMNSSMRSNDADDSEQYGNLITKGGKWLLAEHDTITLEQLVAALHSSVAMSTTSNMIIFKHEPFIMHVACRDLNSAKELLQWGLSCGFRESGIVPGNKKIMCAIRTTANGLEIPIARTADQLLVNEDYLQWIVDIANEKFRANKRKTDQLFKSFKTRFHGQPPPSQVITSVTLQESIEIANEELKRIGHSCVRYGDSIVIFGGQGPSSSGTTTRLADLTIFATNEEGSLEQMFHVAGSDMTDPFRPSPRMHHSAVVVDNQMIVFGGRAGPTKAFNDMYAFDLKAKKWKPINVHGDVFPSARWKHSCCAVGSAIYVYGGRDATSVFGDIFVLNLDETLPQWRVIENLRSAPRCDHIGVVVDETKLLFYGGMTSAEEPVPEDDLLAAKETSDSSCLIFDTKTEMWEPHAISNAWNGPDAGIIAASACTVSDDHVVIVGGMTPDSLMNGNEATQKLCVLDTKRMQWWPLGEVDHPNAAFAYHTCIWSPHNQSMYIIGGGFQCFGFGQFYSSPFQCKISIDKSVAVHDLSMKSKSMIIPNTTKKAIISKDTPSMPRVPSAPSRIENSPLGVLVEKLLVKKVKTLLENAKVYDRTRRVHIVPEGQYPGHETTSTTTLFLIPVTPDIHTVAAKDEALQSLDIVLDVDAYANKFGKLSGLNRNEVIASTILSFATKYQLSASIQAAIPEKYEFVGDVLLVPRESFLESEWRICAEDMWAQVCVSTVPVFTRVARKAFIDPGEKRQSHVELLYVNHQALALSNTRSKQNPGWVEVRENGIIYGWDITRVMFSSGNVTEKARMATIGCRGEVIVDLFCGIGYYVLPFLVHGGAAFVHACEWNPDSVDALRYNLERNHVAHKCQVYLGDNQESAPALGAIADRVNLGLLPTSEKAWPLAIQVLKPEGGWMHVHDNVAVQDRDEWVERVVATMSALANTFGRKWTITCEHVEKVKSYAPRVHHLVADIRFVPL